MHALFVDTLEDSILKKELPYPFCRRCVDINASVKAMAKSKTIASAENRT